MENEKDNYEGYDLAAAAAAGGGVAGVAAAAAAAGVAGVAAGGVAVAAAAAGVAAAAAAGVVAVAAASGRTIGKKGAIVAGSAYAGAFLGTGIFSYLISSDLMRQIDTLKRNPSVEYKVLDGERGQEPYVIVGRGDGERSIFRIGDDGRGVLLEDIRDKTLADIEKDYESEAEGLRVQYKGLENSLIGKEERGK